MSIGMATTVPCYSCGHPGYTRIQSTMNPLMILKMSW